MATPRNFPVEIKTGGTVIRILRDPQRIPIALPSASNPSKAKTKRYDSFVVEYYVGGKRRRIRRNTYKKALAEVDLLKVQLLNNDVEALQITGADRRIYLAALANLKGIDKPLDHVTKEYADAATILHPLGVSMMSAITQFGEALTRLNKTPLATVIEFFERHGGGVKAQKTVSEIVKELVVSLRADGAGKYHIRDLERRLGRFSQSFSGPILNVTESAINEWLRNLRTLPGRRKQEPASSEPLGPKTRNNYRNAVVQLFNFARQAQYLPRDLSTAAEGAKQVKEIRGENEIFTPEQMRELLAGAPAHMIPGMAVKAFSGVRTEEMAEIDWSHILFEQNCIKISAEISKLGQRRLIHLHPNLKAWLKPYRQPTGRLCERWTTPQSVFQAWERHGKRAKLGFDIGGNKFRNSFISYRVAETNNIQLVALESGNSPKTIQREYLEITTPQEAAKWFAIFPKKRK